MSDVHPTIDASGAASVARTRDAGPVEVLASLQLLLQIESLQASLYARAVAATGLVPVADVPVITLLATHASTHLTTIRTAITARTGVPATSPAFDFTVKGALPGFAFAAGQFATLLMLAQMVEDLAVRAYLGQLAALATDKAALETVLSILTVKARHAAEVRRLRGKKGWITGNDRGDLPAFAQPIYDGEETVTQGTISLDAAARSAGDPAAASEAFDEPLAGAKVAAIIALFVP